MTQGLAETEIVMITDPGELVFSGGTHGPKPTQDQSNLSEAVICPIRLQTGAPKQGPEISPQGLVG